MDNGSDGGCVVHQLTDRECDIALRKADGATCSEIGDALGLTARTVQDCWQVAKEKTGLRTMPLVVQVVIFNSRGVN